MSAHLGELAALGTSLCWAATAVIFAEASARLGSLVVNVLRLVMAFGMLALVGAVTRGLPLPTDATPHAWAWLSISALLGLTLGDLCLFRAFVLVGPRLSSLVMSLSPVLTALVGYWALDEALALHQILGMALTVVGVGWAIAERQPSGTAAPVDRRGRALGLVLAMGGAVGQAAGLVLSKLGMGDYDPFAATQIRVLAGALGFMVILTAAGGWAQMMRSLRNTRAVLLTGIGAVFGPFLGISLSLYAVQHTHAGVAASLIATSPLLVIPVVMVLGRERVGRAGILGAVVAVLGVVLLVA